MLQVLRTLPKSLVTVAYSGGVDSGALFHFLRLRGTPIQLAHMVHQNSDTSLRELEFVQSQANKYSIPLVVRHQESHNSDKSREESWRDARLAFFREFDIVVTGHTLDDAVEWYLYTAINGDGKLMPAQTRNVLKPFLHQRKSDLLEFMTENSLEWIEDPSNQLPQFAKRNYVRNVLMPSALEVNPGLYNMIRRRIITNAQNWEQT